MSATLPSDDRKPSKDCLDISAPAIFTGKLGRCGVMFQCLISGDDMATLKRSAVDNLNEDKMRNSFSTQIPKQMMKVPCSIPPTRC